MAWDKVKDRDQRFNVDAAKKAEQRADIPHWEPHPESDSAWHKGKDGKNQRPPAARSKNELGNPKDEPHSEHTAFGSTNAKSELRSSNDQPDSTLLASGSKKTKGDIGQSYNEPSGTRSATGSAKQDNQLGSPSDPPESTYVATGSGEPFTSSQNPV